MWTIGPDIAQSRDPTAIVAAEATEDCFEVRHVERLPLGIPYPVIADRPADSGRPFPNKNYICRLGLLHCGKDAL
jgi:hypothetical protein